MNVEHEKRARLTAFTRYVRRPRIAPGSGQAATTGVATGDPLPEIGWNQ